MAKQSSLKNFTDRRVLSGEVPDLASVLEPLTGTHVYMRYTNEWPADFEQPEEYVGLSNLTLYVVRQMDGTPIMMVDTLSEAKNQCRYSDLEILYAH